MNFLPRFVPGRRLFCVALGLAQSAPPGLFVLRRDGRRAGPSSASVVGDGDRRGVFSDDRFGACLAHGRNRITKEA